MAHIRKGDPEAKTIAFTPADHRVVEGLRGLAVDGDELEVAQVAPALDVRGAHFVRNGFRLRNRRLREAMRQVELAPRDLDLHARTGGGAEHFGDAPDRLHARRGTLPQLDAAGLA